MDLRDREWHWLATAPDAVAAPDQLPTGGWRHTARLSTAAHCLREAGLWALDDPRAPALDDQDWWFRSTWMAERLNGREQLVLEGLATVAEVWVNGRLLTKCDSMFQAQCLALGDVLSQGHNDIQIACRALAPQLQRRRPRPAWRVPMLLQQQLRWHRTTLLGRTPGWSPPVPAVGAWRAIRYDDGVRPVLAFDALQVAVEGEVGTIDVRVGQLGGAAAGPLVLRLHGPAGVQQQPLPEDGQGTWCARLQVRQPALWWPHTHGRPELYELAVADSSGHVLLQRRLGFRTLTVDQVDGDFKVCINGVPVFCRGASWMPLDPVTLSAEAPAQRAAVAQARDAGMNMLRVHGTTVYEDAAFFDACDELGMLVWQDLMFANMDYPGDEGLVRSTRVELEQQARLWRGRPSLAVVCGNSEASQQAAMWGAPRSAWAGELFHGHIPGWMAALLPGVTYWPSSAWGGDFPHQANAGTTSYYGVGAYLRPLGDAAHSRLRFATECLAFANIPDDATLRRLPGPIPVRATHGVWKDRSSHDLGAGWDFNDVRDHYLAELFGVEPARVRYEDHQRYLKLGRATSAEVVQQSFAQWRAAGSACRGALVWFLRDLWAGAGWGVLDDAGRPKSVFHALRRVLQPRAVLLTDDGNNGLTAHLVNEGAQALAARLQVQAWRGALCVERGELTLSVPARGALAVPLARALDHFVDFNRSHRFGPPEHDCVVVCAVDESGESIGQAFHWPAGMGLPRNAALGLRAQAQPQADGRVQVTVRADQAAMAVHFEVNGYLPSDDYFHLAPGREHTVLFTPEAAGASWYGTVDALNAVSPVTIGRAMQTGQLEGVDAPCAASRAS